MDGRCPMIECDGETIAYVLVNGKRFRSIDSRCWKAERRIEDMSADGVSLQVLSPMPELLSYWLKPQPAAELADCVNAAIAEICALHPKQFMGLGMVTLQDPARAVEQLRSFRSMGLRGVEIGTHINGTPLGSEKLFDFYETLQDENLSLFIHPLHPAGCERVGGDGVIASVAAFPMEIAFAATSLIATGLLARLPKLRVLLSHGGGALPLVAARLAAAAGYTDTVAQHFDESPLKTFSRFWFDSNVYDEGVLQFLATKTTPERILAGSDYPFEIRQRDPIQFCCCAMGRTADSFRQSALQFLGHHQGSTT